MTAAFAIWQAVQPSLQDHLSRHQGTVSSGRWCQCLTQLVVQSPLWQAPITLVALLPVGAPAERLFGPVRWLLLYLLGAAPGRPRRWPGSPRGRAIPSPMTQTAPPAPRPADSRP